MSNTAGEEAPTAPLLIRKKPRLARTHMGNTDVADMLDSSTSCRRTYVKRTNAADWLAPVWVADRRSAQSSERPHGAGGGRAVERLVQSETRVSLTFDCNTKLPWWLTANCPKSGQLYCLYVGPKPFSKRNNFKYWYRNICANLKEWNNALHNVFYDQNRLNFPCMLQGIWLMYLLTEQLL